MLRTYVHMALRSTSGGMTEFKSVVQGAAMWQVSYNPFEHGPLAPVIRGNPWGFGKAVANDDWTYVIFD